MEGLLRPLTDILGAPVSESQIKLITCLVICFPLGSLYVRLPGSRPAVKHIFSVAVSAIFLLPVLNLWQGTLELLCSALVTYILAASLQGPNMPWVVFILHMSHLTFTHAYRALHEIPFEIYDISGPQMILTIKLTTFAWNVWDARRPAEELDKWQLKHRVVTMPSLLEFLGYAFYFPGTLAGPAIQYTTYASLIDGSLFRPSEGQGEHGVRDNRVPHGRKRVAFTRTASGFVFLVLFALLQGRYSYQSVLTDTWLHKGLLNRLFTIQMFGFVARTKYYGVWLLAEGACIFTGLGFSEFTPSGRSRWNDAANVDIMRIEWPPNPKILLDSWNITANVWLREAVYKRVARKGKKPGFKSTMVTFVTSAFWHGIASGYYLTFLLGGFFTAAGRLCRGNFRPLFLPPLSPSRPSTTSPSKYPPDQSGSDPIPAPTFSKRIYDFVGSVASLILLNFTVAPFVIGGFYDSLEVWRRMDWYGLWMIGGTFIFFSVGGKRWSKSLAQRRVTRAEKRREEETKGVRVFIPSGGNERTPDSFIVPPVDMAVS